MKKNTITTAAAVLLMTMGTTAATSVSAAEIGTNKTTANAEFSAPATGDLSFGDDTAVVPNLDFGSHEISGDDESYDSVKDAQAQVKDLRGTGAGWKVSVTQTSEFTTVPDDEKTSPSELPGLQISFAGMTADNNTKAVAATLTKGTAVDVWSAAKGTGNGTSTLNIAAGNAKLEVPGKANKLAADYSTTLLWTLDDGVAQNNPTK